MLRISEKLIDFYRRRTEGKRTWIRFVAIVLAMGSIVAFFLYHTLTVRDTREAQTTVEESFAFVKAQLVKYDNYASGDKAKSLVRLMDKADEAARVLRDEPGFRRGRVGKLRPRAAAGRHSGAGQSAEHGDGD